MAHSNSAERDSVDRSGGLARVRSCAAVKERSGSNYLVVSVNWWKSMNASSPE